MNRIVMRGLALPSWALGFGLALLTPQAHAQSAPSSRPAIHKYIYTKAFVDGAKAFYLKEIDRDPQRKKIIATAQEECGGRYESPSIHLTELSHEISSEKGRPVGNDKNYTLTYSPAIDVNWLLVETISCSASQASHSQSILHAVLLSGNESVDVNFRYVNDKQSGEPTISNVKRTYTIGASQFQDQYKTPY